MLLSSRKGPEARKTRRTCPLRSDCRREADGRFVKDLFSTEWEAFVIKHDPAENKYHGFTICCENVTGTRAAPGANLHDCA